MRMHWFGLVIGLIALFYGGLWWYGRSTHPIQYGVSFSPAYAATLVPEWRLLYTEILTDLHPPFIRIAAQWNEIEKEEGVYDFSSIDFMMDEAEKHESKVLLAIGQKVPRWPECFIPEWAKNISEEEYKKKFLTYIEKMVKRYEHHAALEYWQVENEPYIKFDFGECKNFNSNVVDDEIKLVRTTDTGHPVMMTDSGEMSTWIKAVKNGDVFGSTLYRVVRSPKGKIYDYFWLPPGFYRLKALLVGLDSSRFFVAELQAEPWFHESTPKTSPLEEQKKTMDIERFKNHLEYAKHVGASRAYLWGVEWWYWMKYEHNDTSFVDVAKEYLKQ